MEPYEFTQDWTKQSIPVWEELLLPYVGVPARMVEVGSFEGRSTTWLLDNVLTHPEAHIVCVETFAGGTEHAQLDLSELEQRFDRNTARHAHKVTKAKGTSRDVLRQLPIASFDFAYVDGSHQAPDVLFDAVLVWDLVKIGGPVMFDDYGGGDPGVRVAVDAFMECMAGSYELVQKDYSVVLAKTG
jgi:predicted O-methyltransferase YrrM